MRAAGDRPAAAARRGVPARVQRPAGIGLVWPPAPRLAVAVAGVCLLVALGLGALTVHTDHRLTQEQARSTGIAAVLNAPDATMMTAYGSHGGRGTAVMSHSEGELVLTTALLPRLPGSERYEVWLMGPRGVRAAGMLPAARKGMTAPVVVRGLAAGDRVGVTAEPAAGTRRPTTPPVLMFVLQS